MRIRPLIPIVSALVLMLPASAGAVGWVTGTPLSAAGRVAVEHVAIQNGDVYVALDTTRLDGNVRTTTVRVVRLAAGSGQVQAVNGPGGPNLDQASFDSSNQPDTTVPVDSSTITFIRAESKEPLLAAGHGHVDLAWLPSSAQQIDYQELTSGGATQHIATSATSLRAGIDSSGALLLGWQTFTAADSAEAVFADTVPPSGQAGPQDCSPSDTRKAAHALQIRTLNHADRLDHMYNSPLDTALYR